MPHGPYPRVADHVDEIEAAQINTIYDALEDTPTVGEGVPAGGAEGQVLVKTGAGDYATGWRDVPGIVYPSLLLSPDGSFGPEGAVSPTVGSGVTVVEGQYGDAWDIASPSVSLAGGAAHILLDHGTIVVRRTVPPTHNVVILAAGVQAAGNPSANWMQIRTNGTEGWVYPQFGIAGAWQPAVNTPGVASVPTSMGWSWVAGKIASVLTPFGSRVWTVIAATGALSGDLRLNGGTVESVLIYPAALPDAEIARIAAMPAAWSMDNTAANTLIPNEFAPNAQTASGSTVIRTAPGAATQAIKTLSAGTLIEDTFERETASSVIHALIQHGKVSGWVPESQVIAL